MMFISHSTDSTRWRIIFEITWGIGMLFLTLYTVLTWPPTKFMDNYENYIAQWIILIMLYGAMVGARIRFFQFRIVKMYLISLGAMFLLIFLVFRNLGFISGNFMSTFLWIYAIATAVILSTPTKLRK
jgi:hypothetical protein